jgi:hypothetical protein
MGERKTSFQGKQPFLSILNCKTPTRDRDLLRLAVSTSARVITHQLIASLLVSVVSIVITNTLTDGFQDVKMIDIAPSQGR